PAGYASRNSQFGASDALSQRFTGQARDTESGEDFFNARYFTAPLQRFNSPDPYNAGADVTNPQSWNGYSYVWNNPVANVDPLGLDTSSDCGGPCVPFNIFVSGNCTVSVSYSNLTDSTGTWAMPSFTFEGCSSSYSSPITRMVSSPSTTGGGAPPATSSPKSGTPTCVEPNLLQRAGIAVQAGIARLFNKTIGIGAGGSSGAGNILGVSLSVTRQVVVAPNGQAAFATSVSTFTGSIFNSVTTPGYGGYGGIQFSLSNARNVNDLGGSALN